MNTRSVFVLSLAIVFFRFLISLVTRIPYPNFSWIVSLPFLAGFLWLTHWSWKDLRPFLLRPLTIFTTVWAALTFVQIIQIYRFSPTDFKTFYLPIMLSISIVPFFLLPLLGAKFKPDPLSFGRHLLPKAIALVFTLWLLVERGFKIIGGIEADQIRELILPNAYRDQSVTYHYGSVRVLGPLLGLEASGFALAGLACYFFYQFIRSQLPKEKKSFLVFTCISILGGFLSTSFTVLLAIAIGLLHLGFYHRDQINRALKENRRFYIILFSGFATIPILMHIFAPLYSPYYRILDMIKLTDMIVSTWSPDVSGCHFKDLLWMDHLNRSKPDCHFGELHVLGPMKAYGIIPTLPWLLFALSPLVFLFRFKTLSDKKKSYFAFCFPIFISLIHYAVITRWGINYIYFLMIAMLWQPETEINTASATRN